jgi:pimeloyl-ACP methyl ester carboxylesterase
MRVPFVPVHVDTVPSRVVRSANGHNVGVYEYGDPNGSPVFALHGTPACGAGFDWSDAPARERALRVIAPDRPGIGESDPVVMSSVADYAAELAALADALGIDRFAVLGYSGGAPYALAVASALGDRVTIAEIVAGAGEIGAWAKLADLARSDRQLTWLAVHAPIAARLTLRIAEYGARLSPTFALKSTATEMNASDRSVLFALGPPRHALALFTQSMTHGTRGVVTDYALISRPWHVAFADIAVPVHCWHGTADTLVPLSHTTALMERLSGATLTTWPGEGHLGLITHIAEVLDDVAAHTA